MSAPPSNQRQPPLHRPGADVDADRLDLDDLREGAESYDRPEIESVPEAGSERQSLGREIDKGARVRVLSGPFTGKTGIVQELDGKGGGRVLLGLLALQIDLQDLALDAVDRPVFASSHRRPLGDR